MPIALPDFVGAAPSRYRASRATSPRSSPHNLKRSGLFAPIDPAAYIEKITNIDALPRFRRLARDQRAGAGHRARSRARATAGCRTEFRLWDVFGGQQLAGQQYFTTPENWRRIAHIISDAIYERLTGEKGYFDTRIVFVDESGPKERRVKRLAIMDQDGANVRYLTRGDDLVLTPRFSPSTQEITYMSYGQGEPRVYLLNIETGQREIVGNFPGMTFAPRFSPDGQRVIMSLQQGGNSNLFVMDLRSQGDHAADPDARRSTPRRPIRRTARASASNPIAAARSRSTSWPRTAAPRSASASARAPIRRRSGRRAATPSPSPSSGGGRFAIGIMKPDGSGERILTEGFHNEGPTFAPNGRVLMFFRDPGGNPGPQLFTVDITGRNEQRVPTPGFASDPAWSPLLS